MFDGIDLTGTKTKLENTEMYEDDDFVYEESGDTLIVTKKQGGESLTIENWNSTTKEALGITLSEGGDIEVSVGSASELEAAEMMRVSVELQRNLEDDEQLEVELGYYTNTYKTEETGKIISVGAKPETTTYDSYTGVYTVNPASPAYTYPETRQIVTGQVFHSVGSVTFEPGEGKEGKTFIYRWTDNDHIYRSRPNISSYNETNNTYYHTWDATTTLIPRTNEETSSYGDNIAVTVKKSGSATIIDDDERGRYDPLVLDTNKDGFISTTSLDESNTYFDITGDGLRERIGWVGAEDGLLVFDKNDNGQIEGISELFGSLDESGFEELKRLIDSNHDNTIDRKDELFSRLQVWHDKNQDAKVQEGELVTLKEEGVDSIDLNLVETSIEINGNLLTEASKYTDAQGNKELLADIQLATDAKDTKVDIDDIPGFTIDESTRELPQLKGSGLVYDAFIKYNTSEEFKALSEVLATDISKASNNFQEYIELWSGYTEFENELKERYSLSDDFSMAEADKRAWIVERFEAKDDLLILNSRECKYNCVNPNN